jgi:hypothetical protein
MSLENITHLNIKFKNIEELQLYCDSQYRSLQRANEVIKKLEAEIVHLKNIIVTTVPIIEPKQEQFIVSTEQSICEMEIERLRKTSMDRGLTLEETKRLDLLVKNLHIAKKGTKDIAPDYKKLPETSEAELLQIAATPEPSIEDV